MIARALHYHQLSKHTSNMDKLLLFVFMIGCLAAVIGTTPPGMYGMEEDGYSGGRMMTGSIDGGYPMGGIGGGGGMEGMYAPSIGGGYPGYGSSGYGGSPGYGSSGYGGSPGYGSSGYGGYPGYGSSGYGGRYGRPGKPRYCKCRKHCRRWERYMGKCWHCRWWRCRVRCCRY